MDDPKEIRMIQTRDGVARVPRSQVGVSLRDYFQNTELPENLERAQVFVTEQGPVAAPPDPVAWTEEHTKKVQQYAHQVKEYVDDKGKYGWKLTSCANALSRETGYRQAEMKAHIVAAFTDEFGQDPYQYLREQRIAKGLPVRDRQPEMGRQPEPDF